MHKGEDQVVATSPSKASGPLLEICVDDVAGLTRVFDQLAVPEEAALQGKAARGHHDDVCDPRRAAGRLLEILRDVTGRP